MFLVRELTAKLGEPFEVLENRVIVELWCKEHGRVAVFSAGGDIGYQLEQVAARHRRAYHCGDA